MYSNFTQIQVKSSDSNNYCSKSKEVFGEMLLECRQ